MIKGYSLKRIERDIDYTNIVYIRIGQKLFYGITGKRDRTGYLPINDYFIQEPQMPLLKCNGAKASQ